MQRFDSPQQLESWLQQRGIATAQWGQAGAKSVSDLWTELCVGDASLEDEPVVRRVRVVELLIQRDQQVLLEAAQEFGTGERRHRQRLPAEKMKPGETPEQAAQRCLAEELGVAHFQFTPAPITTDERQQISPSYPGLLTIYNTYRLRLAAPGLPAGDFSTPNAAYAAGDPVRAHYWTWIAQEVGERL